MMIKNIEVLIPTYNRLQALSVTLTSLYYQKEKSFDITISDQSSNDEIWTNDTVQTIIRLLQTNGHEVKIFKNLPRKGMAQQREFLLSKSEARYSIFLDDD